MPSPFPGLDPFIEAQDRWHSFHPAFIVACSDELNKNLPHGFYATIEERVLLDATDPTDDSARRILRRMGPDATVVQRQVAVKLSHQDAGVATLIPRTLPQAIVSFDQATQKLIEIRGLPNRTLVTTIEVLSPSNKVSGADRSAYLVKRADMLHRGVNVVDLDLLMKGQRLPLLAPLPQGDFHAFVTRATEHSVCDVYSWTLHEAMPTILIPLRPGMGDVALPLQAAFTHVYDSSRYSEMLMYEEKSLLQALNEGDRDWAAALLPT